nr:TetR family transcriptional regulator [Mycolicibacterium malmesburyense]
MQAVGAENATMRRVADRLGMSVPGLYHHVANKDELLELAARHALTNSPPPRYDGQHWAVWLRTYARYVRRALSAEPALLEKFLSGAVSDEGEIDYVAEALDVLHAQGLSPDDAISVWAAVSALAIGSVTEAHRERVNAESGQPWPARIAAATARRGPSEFPTLRAVAASRFDPFGDGAFEDRLTWLLAGICEHHRLAPEPVRPRRRS